ncbi:MAG: DUF4065 domain-containing protein [Flavobacteriaceae bacterium]|nr:DUF4065 domain-containing protein [Flavobacteriaceae bacterium]
MYFKNDIEKLGNTIIYLADRIDDLSKTKLLKILYLLDEFSIKEFGLPFLNLKYEVWQLGPVAQDIFIDLSDEPIILKDYIKINTFENKRYIQSKKEFSDDEFSDNELNLLDKLTQTVKNEPAYVLINFTHKKDSLWYNTASRHNLLEMFEMGIKNSSNIELNFEEIIQNEPIKLSIYNHHKELESSLKGFRIC